MRREGRWSAKFHFYAVTCVLGWNGPGGRHVVTVFISDSCIWAERPWDFRVIPGACIRAELPFERRFLGCCRGLAGFIFDACIRAALPLEFRVLVFGTRWKRRVYFRCVLGRNIPENEAYIFGAY